MKVICGIYKITNLINNKCYIGQSTNIKLRWKSHRVSSRNAKNTYPLYLAIRKYGLSNFQFEILEECKKEDLNKREKYWAIFYNAYIWDNGYNVAHCGENNESYHYMKLTEEIYLKIVDDLKNSELSQRKLAKKYKISTTEICGINVGRYLYHDNLEYPIRKKKVKVHKYCELCNKEVDPTNINGICESCINKILKNPSNYSSYYIDKAKNARRLNDEKNNFMSTNERELFSYLYYNDFSLVATKYETTKKRITGYLLRRGIPNTVDEFRNWIKIKYPDILPKIKTIKVNRPKIIQLDKNKNQLNIFSSASDAAIFINKGISNHGSHIYSAAKREGNAYGYYWKFIDNFITEEIKIYPEEFLIK